MDRDFERPNEGRLGGFTITGEPHTNDDLPELVAALEPYDSKDFETAIKLLTPIAETGNLTALFKLANCHRDVGNLELATHIYELGIAHGDSRCMNNLAIILKSEGDEEGAINLYRKAAEAGHAEPAYNLAVRLKDKGEFWEAIEWAKKSYEAGYIRAPSMLSILLEKEAQRFHQVGLEMKSLTALSLEIGQLMIAGKLEAALELVDKVDIHYVDASEEHQIGVYCWAAGSLLFILKDFARAAEYLEIALQHRHRLTQEQIKKAEEMLEGCRNK
jgi:TPR repeat protein